MIETYRLCDRIKEALNAKRFAVAVGRSKQTIYEWCRDPNDPEVSGSPNLFDWLEAVIEKLAMRKEGRPVLIQIRAWINATIDRALSAWPSQPLTRDTLALQTSETLREFSELLRECCPEDFDRERVLKEGADVIEAVERLIRAAEHGLIEEERLSLRAAG